MLKPSSSAVRTSFFLRISRWGTSAPSKGGQTRFVVNRFGFNQVRHADVQLFYEGLDDGRVKLGAGAAAQLGKRLGNADRLAVAPVRDHRLERVADSDDAGA